MKDINQAQTSATDSPSAASLAPAEHSGADVTEESSTSSRDDASGDSSPAAGEKTVTLHDIIAKGFGPTEDEDTSETAAESPTEAKAKSEEKSDDEPQAKQDGPAKVEKKDDAFDESSLSEKARQRFQHLRNEAKQLDEVRRLTGDDAGFQNFVSLLRTMDSDPAQAVTMLEQLTGTLREQAGMVVKSEDIRSRLDDGAIDEATALELEQARSEKARLVKQREAEAAQQSSQATLNLLQAWRKNTAERDPGFEAIEDRVQDRAKLLVYQENPTTPDEFVAIAQKAYDEITGWARAKFAPAKPMKVATSSGSSTKGTAKPRSVLEIVQAHLG
jgi:hypothetical protein